MRVQRSLLTVAVTGFLAANCLSAFAQTASSTPATQTSQKNYKDRAEYDLYDSIIKDTNPKTRLDKLNQWKQKYPSTDFSAERETLFFTTYAALQQIPDALNIAKEILARDPKDFQALYYRAYATPLLPNLGTTPTPEQLDAAQNAANAILAGAKPANMSDADWQKAKNDIEAVAHTALGFVAMSRKQNETAETEFKKSVELNPKSGQVPFWIGNVILAEGKSEKYPEAIFYFARAAAYDGEGALLPAGRTQMKDMAQKYYTKFHGGADKFDDLLATAKTNPAPPAGFTIVSTADKAKAALQQEQQFEQSHPDLALWKNIKDALTGANAQSYFDSSMKGAALPGGANGVQKFTAKVISMEPATKPKTLVVGIENGTTADATLKFEAPLPGKVDAGTEIKFSGVAESYTSSPFMVTFNVDKKDLEGWTGTNPAPVRRRTAPRKH